jgi:hypothetical protein
MGPEDKLPGPIAHQGPILILYSRAPIEVDKSNMHRGWDRGRCRWRCRGSEDQSIRKHLKPRLGLSDHPVRVHWRSHSYSHRRSSNKHHRSRAHGHRWRGLPGSLCVDDLRGRPLTRWCTIRGRGRCSSCAWHSRRLWSRMWCNWGCLGHVRHNMCRRGRTGQKSRRDCRCG